MIDLENKSNELKKFVASYDTASFMGNISLMMQMIASPDKLGSLQGLNSPQRQLYYVASLNLTSPQNKVVKERFSDEEWNEIKRLLREIEAGYNQFFYPQKPEDITEEWIARRRVAMPSFLSYFNVGHLNYEEQVIERIIEYFTPFESQIQSSFGIGINDFINIYNYVDSLPNKYLDEKINHKEGNEGWKEFATRMSENGITPDKWMEQMPQNLKNVFEMMQDSGQMYRFAFSDLELKFGKEMATNFLAALTSQREETSFLYYTEQNPLSLKPLFKVKNDEYQILETKQLIHAIYNLLAAFCINDPNLKDKFYAVRGDKLENKIERVFQKFFKNKATVYKGFYTTKAHEQDLLIIYNGTALIIEAKASKRKEPRRDPDKAYELILNNFDETIQKGYDQAYRVKEFFINQQPLKIYSDQGLTKQIAEINTKKIYNVFSIVVTLETFGLIQSDLTEVLEVYDDDMFPWSIGIDDLEVFLLAFQKQKKTLANLVHFLNVREQLHGHLFCSDELEVCGAFLQGKIDRKIANGDDLVVLFPDMSSIFDGFYHWGGLGFDNEKNMHIKTDPKYFRLGIDSPRNKGAAKR